MRLVGYELLHRRSGTARASAISHEDELAALANVLVEVGLDRLAAQATAYVNVPASLLGCSALRLLPIHRVVLEVLEDTRWTREVERNLTELKGLGYKLALDDYTFGAEHAPFLDHVDIVKVDVLGIAPNKLQEKMLGMNRQGKVFLAEKVETKNSVEFCRSLGFDHFQGYFIAEPTVIKGTGIRGNLALSMALIAKLNDPHAKFEEIDKLLSGNVVLCHKILRLVNSVDICLPQKIDSVGQAIKYLGIDKIRTLASMAVTTAIPGKSPELYSLAIIRANYCESLARSLGYPSPEKHYLVGLLSVIEAITNVSMVDLLAELPLSPDITASLLGKAPESTCSIALRHVLAVERGDWNAADQVLTGVPERIYVDAVDRARRDEQFLAA